MVGLGGLEPPASSLSGMRSNQAELQARFHRNPYHKQLDEEPESTMTPGILLRISSVLRKEVIQPQVLLRLPCYDFTPVINRSLDACLPKGGSAASAPVNSHGVTGGVDKARERIHRGVLIRDY